MTMILMKMISQNYVTLTSTVRLQTSGQHAYERRLSSSILAKHHDDFRIGKFTGFNIQLEVTCEQTEATTVSSVQTTES